MDVLVWIFTHTKECTARTGAHMQRRVHAYHTRAAACTKAACTKVPLTHKINQK